MMRLLTHTGAGAQLCDRDSLSTAARHAYHFCEKWLNGENIFEVRTSGSTGEPKLISFTKKQMTASAVNTATVTGYAPGDLMHVCIDTQHIGGMMQLVRSLVFKMDIYIYDAGIYIVDALQIKAGRHHISLTPPMAQQALKTVEGTDKINKFTSVLIGGSSISDDLAIHFKTMQAQVFHTYGMTETCSNAAMRDLTAGELFFTALPGWKIKPGEDGCLSLFNERITDHCVHTNDLVEFKSDQTFLIKGRADFIINSGGIKYVPEVLEATLSTNQFLPELICYVSAKPHPVWGESLVLVIESTASGIEKISDSWLEDANNIFGKNILREVYIIQKIPLTANGKPDRKRLKEILSEH